MPLEPATHGDALYAGTCGAQNDWLWDYLGSGPFADRESFDRYLEKMAAADDPLAFAVIDNVSGCAAGLCTYLRIDPANRVIEVGHILYSPALQKTAAATEAMYLMARHAFDDLGYRRYEWKCNALNQGSRSAALRLGFTFEGIFRQHMIVKGRNRDTAWFSMLDCEWPACKTAIEEWLNAANFDADGRQLRSLAAFRRGVK
jgi:RimJ/RimL family protein N-acetyltransferase